MKRKLILLIIISLALLAYELAPIVVANIRKMYGNQANVTTGAGSTFGNIVAKQQNPENQTQTEVGTLEQFGGDADKLNAYRYGMGATKLDPTALWDYKDVPFQAEVTDVDAALNTITLKFTSPESMPFIGTEKTYKSPCTPDITFTYITADKRTYTSKDPEDYRNLVAGANLMSFCMDAQCSTLGRLCRSEYPTKQN